MANERIEDGIQHGIDDNPNNDAEKGATIGGLGGAAVGAAAGSMMGPVGAVIGAAVGGLAGAAASGAAVAAIDDRDNDDNITGVGDDVAYDHDVDDDDDVIDTHNTYADRSYATTAAPAAGTVAHDDALGYRMANNSADTLATDPFPNTPPVIGSTVPPAVNPAPGIQTGGTAVDGTPDTRGVMEKTADAITGDRIDDKTGKPVR